MSEDIDPEVPADDGELDVGGVVFMGDVPLQ
jgi:hypothetical protein